MCRDIPNELAEECQQCSDEAKKQYGCVGRFIGQFYLEDCPASDDYLPHRIGGLE